MQSVPCDCELGVRELRFTPCRLHLAALGLLEAAKESLYLLKSLTGDALSGTDCAKGKTMLRNAIAKAEGVK